MVSRKIFRPTRSCLGGVERLATWRYSPGCPVLPFRHRIGGRPLGRFWSARSFSCVPYNQFHVLLSRTASRPPPLLYITGQHPENRLDQRWDLTGHAPDDPGHGRWCLAVVPSGEFVSFRCRCFVDIRNRGSTPLQHASRSFLRQFVWIPARTRTLCLRLRGSSGPCTSDHGPVHYDRQYRAVSPPSSPRRPAGWARPRCQYLGGTCFVARSTQDRPPSCRPYRQP